MDSVRWVYAGLVVSASAAWCACGGNAENEPRGAVGRPAAEASPNEGEAPPPSGGGGASSAGASSTGASSAGASSVGGGGATSAEVPDRDLELAGTAGAGGSRGESSPIAGAATQPPALDAGSSTDPSDDQGEGTQAAPDAGPEPSVLLPEAEPPAEPNDVTPPIERAPVDVVVGECQGFTPCGGDLDGVWAYTAACVDPADLGVSEAQLALCPGANLTLSGEVSGTLSFADGRMTRRGESIARGQIAVPALCALVLGGCAGVTRELVDAGLAGATCSPGRGLLPSCSCRFSLVAPALEDVAFETSGAVLRTSNGRTYEYCVEADELSYVEVGAAREPGERRLSR